MGRRLNESTQVTAGCRAVHNAQCATSKYHRTVGHKHVPEVAELGNTRRDDLSFGDRTQRPRGLSGQSTVASARRDSKSKMCSFVASTTTILQGW